METHAGTKISPGRVLRDALALYRKGVGPLLGVSLAAHSLLLLTILLQG
jgi:hypothetical protein